MHKHTHVHIHTYIHTYIHTHTHSVSLCINDANKSFGYISVDSDHDGQRNGRNSIVYVINTQ